MRSFPTKPRPTSKLIVFARLPRPGRVKKRLSSEIGDEKAARIYRAMIEDLLEKFAEDDPEFDVEIAWVAPGEVAGEELRDLFGDRRLATQSGRDLGERLVVAFSEKIVFHHTEKVVAIGVDEPTLDRDSVMHAFRLLDGCDWVIGPSRGGRCYLIGCRSGSFHPSVFEKIEWGTPRVFPGTESGIRALGASAAILPERLEIDSAGDLRRLAARGAQGAPRVHALIDEWELNR
ncbi:MAG TPA: TIGR04282 family arsenosugar biosynthesis glycosyltransferase [Thermoanaerobaculia bacterium]